MMRKWLPWLIVPVILASLVVAFHSRHPSLLQDTDTRVLLEAIRERQDPWSWFTGDWPLENHFYRPISTLVFEIDNSLYGDRAAGYGLTNAILAAVCIIAVFWLGRELTDSAPLAGLGSTLFALQHFKGPVLEWISSALWLLAGLVWLRLLFKGRQPARILLLSLLLAYCAWTIPGPINFDGRIVEWLPGRTASTMTMFALVAMAAYARFERLTAAKGKDPIPTSTDLPATKGTAVAVAGKYSWVWVGIALMATILALGSYEQAVMLPALITGIAILYVSAGRKPNWWVVASTWLVLVAYLVIRSNLVASEVSQYQSQQFRSGPGVMLSILEYVAPLYSWMQTFVQSLSTGLLILLTGAVWAPLFS
ncbi:hypothetical protein QPK87_04980 [Kamptonema cortianum]|nr:hypothetical protein [Kamptonema cortianum]